MFSHSEMLLNAIKNHFYGFSLTFVPFVEHLIGDQDKTVSMVIITQFAQIEFN